MKESVMLFLWLAVFVPMLVLFLNAQAVFAATNIGLNITTGGDLTVDGNLKFTNGASLDHILQSDASGNASWVSMAVALGAVSAEACKIQR